MTFIYELDPCGMPWRYTGFASVNFLRQGFRKLSSDGHTFRQTDTIEIIYHGSSRVVNKAIYMINRQHLLYGLHLVIICHWTLTWRHLHWRRIRKKLRRDSTGRIEAIVKQNRGFRKCCKFFRGIRNRDPGAKALFWFTSVAKFQHNVKTSVTVWQAQKGRKAALYIRHKKT